MKKLCMRVFAAFIAALIFACAAVPTAFTADDNSVEDVISKLEAIDTLEQMQSKRATFTVSGHWDASNPDMVAEHTSARNGYESYVADMFAARREAKEAYEALTDAQKSQISAELVAKLNDELPIKYNFNITKNITRRYDEYCYEVIFPRNLVYELSSHFSPSVDMPATIVVTNTAERDSDTWTPDGPYSYGGNNYDLTYCCDLEVMPVDGTHYKLLNLEDGSHYSNAAAKHIRAIVENSYPFVSIDEMKAGLKAKGLDPDFVDSLNRSDIICGVQMAIWAYSNMSKERIEDAVFYGGTLDIETQRVMTPIHNYKNELWDWWSTARNRRSYSDDSAYKVNNLVYFLFNLDGEEATEEQLIISNVEVTRAELAQGSSDTYEVGMYVTLNGKLESDDDIEIVVKSGHDDGDGNFVTTDSFTVSADTKSRYPMTVNAKAGDTVTVETKGIQNVAKGVYLYEPEGGKEASQSLVGVTEGPVRIRAKQQFVFNNDVEKGLRIFKSSADDGLPISGISFDVFRADGASGDEPSQQDVDTYAVEANKAGTAVTDDTGYAALSLENGKYLVKEVYDPSKVEEAAPPFYITIPMPVENTQDQFTDIVSVYPKNKPVTPPDDIPELTIPDNVSGTFSIIKYKEGDESKLLEGAEFKVYRTAGINDTQTVSLECGDKTVTAAAVKAGDEDLVLKTDGNGAAESPALPCGVYYLEEIKAPAGYRKTQSVYSVTVVQDITDTPAQTIRISNRTGNLLPETGGIGTAIFTSCGLALMLTSLIFIIKKKKSETANA